MTRCLNCGRFSEGPTCACGATWAHCTCAKPIVINGKTFIPAPSQSCPVHFEPVIEHPEPPDFPDPADLREQWEAKMREAGYTVKEPSS